MLGFKFRISADAFFQVNQGAAEVLYHTVREMCLPDRGRRERGGILLDLCCGTGAIGIAMSPRVDRVIGIELIEQAVEDARHNAALNGVFNCEFLQGKAEVVLPQLIPELSSISRELTVVVNPAAPACTTVWSGHCGTLPLSAGWSIYPVNLRERP